MEAPTKSNTHITVRYWRHRSSFNIMKSFSIFCEICKRRRSENRKKLHAGKEICIYSSQNLFRLFIYSTSRLILLRILSEYIVSFPLAKSLWMINIFDLLEDRLRENPFLSSEIFRHIYDQKNRACVSVSYCILVLGSKVVVRW